MVRDWPILVLGYSTRCPRLLESETSGTGRSNTKEDYHTNDLVPS